MWDGWAEATLTLAGRLCPGASRAAGADELTNSTISLGPHLVSFVLSEQRAQPGLLVAMGRSQGHILVCFHTHVCLWTRSMLRDKGRLLG